MRAHDYKLQSPATRLVPNTVTGFYLSKHHYETVEFNILMNVGPIPGT